ncbi:acyl-CoA dehydrogenase [Xylophilus rhododendri]|uniref:Acyl-CoA dehydrogenase n=1 Tax=Xylophilus rhododendri TaxID=2697032 RepID=A0A857JCV3_9BURK|nr:acyl-CoA dehydrogenase family protein [Xylophilus rhododendri]QHJ01032.1 acyl-CoA dehydrogenase [Xylophilus rhododendri]
MFTEAFEDILRDRCTPAVVRAIEAGGDHQALWGAIAEAGFLELMAAEEAGGAGLPLAELYPIVRLLGRYALPLPVGQSLAARALLPSGEVPAGLITLAPAVQPGQGGWFCPQVPYGRVADWLLADDGASLLLLDCKSARRETAGVPLSQTASLHFPADTPVRRFPRLADAQRAMGAALHAALLAGAASRAFEITLQYGNDRSQFGRSIGKFQAIQHSLSVMAEQVAAAGMAAQAAFASGPTVPTLLAAAVAKARTSEAALPIANTAHAVHGAIGITEEYDLQLFTRRLHEWRIAHGSEDHWHAVVGRALVASDLPMAEFVRSIAA